MEHLFLVIPSFGDSRSVIEISQEVEKIVECPITICILDDSAGVDYYPSLPPNYNLFVSQRNCGQQKILTDFLRSGLANRFEVSHDDFVIIMDGDGEDSPRDIPRMIARIENEDLDLLTAQRGSRSAPISFKLGYFCFQVVGKVLTGELINHGTFSVSRRIKLENWVQKETFSHSFVGGLVSISSSKGSLICDRERRRYGDSRLSNIGLIKHGLKIFVSLSPQVNYQLLLYGSLWVLFSSLFIISTIVFKTPGATTSRYLTINLIILIPMFMMLIVAFFLTKRFLKKSDDSNTSNTLTLRKSRKSL